MFHTIAYSQPIIPTCKQYSTFGYLTPSLLVAKEFMRYPADCAMLKELAFVLENGTINRPKTL